MRLGSLDYQFAFRTSNLTMDNMTSKKKELLALVSFLILVPLLSHLLFSWMGFTPTDEGFTLAHSRRILDGQVPHRDFIIIRPFFSPLLHVPEVLVGGDYIFWLSRMFVWFQLACMSWMWVSIGNRLTNAALSLRSRFSLALIAFAATTHTKHLTAWPTIDGLFFVAIGLALCVRKERLTKLAGYFLLGISPLCKQSFVFVVPLTLFILSDWTHLRYWLAAALAPSCYLFYLILAHAVSDAILQLTANTQLWSVGFQRYLDFRVVIPAIVGYLTCRLIYQQRAANQRFTKAMAVSIVYYLPLLGTAVSLWFGILMNASFLLFGLLAGTVIYLLTDNSGLSIQKRFVLLALLTAWSASISLGYNSPALGSGPILVALVVFVLSTHKGDRTLEFSLVAAALVIILSFGIARTRYIYRDQPAANLNKSLEGVLPGGNLVYTNGNTYEFMSDLGKAIKLVEESQKAYAIIPDCAAYWVKATQENPLPAVWPITTEELSKPVLVQRFIEAMEQKRSSTIFIVQKVAATTLANGFTPLPSNEYYEVVRYARAHFNKMAETSYFELYK